MGAWDVAPSEFWQMSPSDFWLIYDGKMRVAGKGPGAGPMTRPEFDDLCERLRAKGIEV